MADTYAVTRDAWLDIGGTKYKVLKTLEENVETIDADLTGSGDLMEKTIPIRARGRWSGTVLSDATMRAMNGSIGSVGIYIGTATDVTPVEALIKCRPQFNVDGVMIWNVEIIMRALPSEYTALAAL